MRKVINFFREEKVKLFSYVLNSFTLIMTLLFFSGCFSRNKIEVILKNHDIKSPDVTVSAIQVKNNQVIIIGTNLNSVTGVKINDGSFNLNLAIESNSGTSLVLNTLTNITFAAGKFLNFVISSANASSTYTVNFSLCDSLLGGKGFNCNITPNDKEVLSYDAISGKWRPRAVNGISYQGIWDANTSFPTTTSPGDYFIVSIPHGIYNVGDWIVFNGSTFDLINNSNVIVNVFGRTGVITATKGDYNLNKMADVDLTTTPPASGDVLKFNGTNWVPGTVSGGGGTINSVTGTAPIVSSGGTTPVISITQASSSTNGYLSSTDWNTFNNKQSSISAGTVGQFYRGDKTWATLSSDAVVEGASNLYFTNARALGSSLTGFSATNSIITGSDSVLSAFGKAQGQINNLTSGGSNYLVKNSTDNISGLVVVNGTGDLQVGTPLNMTSAINKSYVISNYLPLSGGELTSDLILDTQAKFKGGSNYVTIKASASQASNITLTLPLTTGTSGQVLQTDGTGVLSWTTPSAGSSPTGVAGGDLSGSYPNPSLKSATITDSHIATTLSQSKITNLTSDLASKQSTTLANGKILVGNSSNIATPVSMSGDAIIDNTGAVTLSVSGVTAGTYNTVAVDSKGRVTVGSNTSYVSSVTGTAPIVSSGGATPAISIAQATTSTNGYLSSTDWNTFNSKQSTISKSTVQDVSKLRIYGANASNYVELSAATLTGNRSLIFPDSNGSSGYVLSTDGAGVLSWIAIPSAPVTTVAGRTGAITLSTNDVSEGSNLYFNNTRVLGVPLTGFTPNNSAIVATDTVLDAFGKAQGQINSKLSTSSFIDWQSSGVQTIDPSRLNLGAGNASKAVITNGSGAVIVSSVTSSELGYLSGSTSNIQAQLNAKQGAIDKTSTQDMSKLRIYGANASNYVELSAATLTGNRSLIFPDSNGANGQVLSTNGSGILSWVSIPSAPVSSVNGNTGVVTLTTSNVSEGTNLYFTDSRALGALLTTPTLTNSSIAANDSILVALGKLQAQFNDVLNIALTGLTTASNSALLATDTILISFGKLQAQITSLGSTKLDKTGGTLTIGTIDGVPNPVSNNQVANKAYVDSVVSSPSVTCPTNYVLVPANTAYFPKQFCVMKYEAKDDGYGGVVSTTSGGPWVSIDRPTARAVCQALGFGYDLISNDQWQTIARNIAGVAINWSTGTVANGELNRGHSDSSPNYALGISNDNDPCNGTGETCSTSTWNSQRRTHVLSNGNIIWDFAGNVWEWVTNDNNLSFGADGFISTISAGNRQARYGALLGTICASPASSPYCGMGYGWFNYSSFGAVARSGAWNNDVYAGVFASGLNRSPSDKITAVGFRCVFVP